MPILAPLSPHFDLHEVTEHTAAIQVVAGGQQGGLIGTSVAEATVSSFLTSKRPTATPGSREGRTNKTDGTPTSAMLAAGPPCWSQGLFLVLVTSRQNRFERIGLCPAVRFG
jgi:hypothetical protein